MKVRTLFATVDPVGVSEAHQADWGEPVDYAELRAAILASVPIRTTGIAHIDRTPWNDGDEWRFTVNMERDGQGWSSLTFRLGEIAEMEAMPRACDASPEQIVAALVNELQFHGSPDQREEFLADLKGLAAREQKEMDQ